MLFPYGLPQLQQAQVDIMLAAVVAVHITVVRLAQVELVAAVLELWA